MKQQPNQRAISASNITVLLWLLCSSVVANADSTTELFEAINARLSYMQPVAEYKELFHLPVEDLPREATVLEEAKLAAATAGLQPDSVVEFFRIQMTLSKIIQYRHRATLLSGTAIVDTPDLENDIRPALDTLGTQINQLLAARIQEIGNINETDWTLFSRIIDDIYLDAANERRLFQSLLPIRSLYTEERE